MKAGFYGTIFGIDFRVQEMVKGVILFQFYFYSFLDSDGEKINEIRI